MILSKTALKGSLKMDAEKTVKELISGLCGKNNIQNGDTFKEDLAIDSLSFVVLLVEIEERFSVEFDESDMDPMNLNKVQDVIDLVKKYGKSEKSE